MLAFLFHHTHKKITWSDQELSNMANQHISDVCKLCPEGHIHPILFIYLFIFCR